VIYVKGVLSALAAVLVAVIGPELLDSVRAIGQQKATGLGVFIAGFGEAWRSPLHWVLVASFFALFFAASRLSSKALRITLFWIPTLACTTLGLGLIALFTSLWLHFRRA
jgi:hypothetical protein